MIILSNIGWTSGLKEWVLQRLTGIYIVFYFLLVFLYLILNDGFNYLNWFSLFSSFSFKIITLLFVFSLVLHSSIGISVIVTDYIKHALFRVIFDFVINIILLSYIFCVMQILWGFK